MERERPWDLVGRPMPEEGEPDARFGSLLSEREEEHRPGPTWRGLVIAVIAAIVLSVGATLLLGGTYRFSRQGAASGCGAGAAADCCAPPESGQGGR